MLFYLTQRAERFADLLCKNHRLFPGGKMTAFLQLVIMNELWKSFLCPGLWYLIDLIREGAYCYRDRNVLYVEEGQLVLPVEACRRDRSTRQPIKRYVVEDI